MKSDNRFLLLFGFIISSLIVMFGLWNVDIGVSGMMNEKFFRDNDINATSTCTNGWYSFTPVLTYHVGLYEIIGGLMSIVIIFCYYFTYENVKNERGKEKEKKNLDEV